MNLPTLDVPDVVRRSALSRGPQGAAWLRDLGRIVVELEGEWGLQVGRSLRCGTESFVVEARTAAGEDAVLKIALPGREPEDGEARILIAAAGRGYVRAFRYDERRRALLQERLGPQLYELCRDGFWGSGPWSMGAARGSGLPARRRSRAKARRCSSPAGARRCCARPWTG